MLVCEESQLFIRYTLTAWGPTVIGLSAVRKSRNHSTLFEVIILTLDCNSRFTISLR